MANATSTIAVWPGVVSTALAYRKELTTPRRELYVLIAICLAGGTCGSLLLLNTPTTTFNFLIPWLLLGATLLFAFGPHIKRFSLQHKLEPSQPHAGAFALQFVIALYGGYFGAGIGILMLALFSLLGRTRIHEMNALKSLLAAVINVMAVLIFILSGLVEWRYVPTMILGTVIGGYFGARYAQRFPEILVRRFVIVVASVMTVWFFVRR